VLGLIVAAGSAHASERVAVCARYGVQDGYSHGYTVDATLTNGRELDQATGTFNYDALATYVVIFWSQDEVSVIRMDWNTGESQAVPYVDLRFECPCAACVDEMSARAILNPDSVPTDIRPVSLALVGAYGLRVQWSDGHGTGIMGGVETRHVYGNLTAARPFDYLSSMNYPGESIHFGITTGDVKSVSLVGPDNSVRAADVKDGAFVVRTPFAEDSNQPTTNHVRVTLTNGRTVTGPFRG